MKIYLDSSQAKTLQSQVEAEKDLSLYLKELQLAGFVVYRGKDYGAQWFARIEDYNTEASPKSPWIDIYVYPGGRVLFQMRGSSPPMSGWVTNQTHVNAESAIYSLNMWIRE